MLGPVQSPSPYLPSMDADAVCLQARLRLGPVGGTPLGSPEASSQARFGTGSPPRLGAGREEGNLGAGMWAPKCVGQLDNSHTSFGVHTEVSVPCRWKL